HLIDMGHEVKVQSKIYAVDVRAARARGMEPQNFADPTRYLQALIDSTSFIDIRGIARGSGEAKRFPIEDLYITLRVEPRSSDRDSRQALPLEALWSEKRLVILGDAGSGKTTYLRRLTKCLCESVLRHDQPETAH